MFVWTPYETLKKYSYINMFGYLMASITCVPTVRPKPFMLEMQNWLKF